MAARGNGSGALRGISVALVLVAVAVAVPHVVHPPLVAESAAPLSAEWRPRLGWGTLPATAMVLLCLSGRVGSLARGARWGVAVGTSCALSLAWMASLALVDGVDGIAAPPSAPTEYLLTAQTVTDLRGLLEGFAERIPLHANGNWPVHVAGHPPGALLFFVALDRVGLGSGLAAGMAVMVVAASVPAAVAVTLRVLGDELSARRALPLLAVGPFAIWQAVSADALFAAVAAWSVSVVAVAATRRATAHAVAWALGAGLLLGCTIMLSYGLVLVALLIGAVLLHRRRPVLAWPVAVGLAAVVGVFAALGFRWWAAYPVLHERYWAGLASARPAWYWLLGNLAALALCLGPAVWAGLGVAARRATSEPIPLWRGGLAWSGWGRPAAALVVAASLCVLAAELSLMSKAEVERIWLPFVPWLVLATGWLPAATDRRLLAVQAATGLLLAHLVWSPW